MPTTLEAPTTITPGPLAEVAPYRFSVADFYRMIDLDFFARESRVGLWDGQVYEKMSKNPPHVASSIMMVTALGRVLPPGWSISAENPITIGPDLAPLPEFALLRGRGLDYSRRRPAAEDVGLLVEISESSLKLDTGVKLAAYAKAGISAYWVVNLVAHQVQVYRDPILAEGRYATTESFAPGTMIPLVLDGVVIGPIAASDLLPDA